MTNAALDPLEDLAREGRSAAAVELLRGRETTRVLDALAQHGVAPVLLKGTALAYSIYRAPHLRPRCDTDLIVARDDVNRIRPALAGIGYHATNVTDGELVLRQFEMARTDEYGVLHAFDFHWAVSTQAVFADLLSYDELRREAEAIPALGASARGPSRVHALLLACVHPAMHHRNEERVVWVYDVHLLASSLSADELARFADLAVARGVAMIAASELARARERFGTAVPPGLLARLRAVRGEPSAAYLEPGRSWRHDLVSSVAALPRWSDRWRLIREVALPGPAYMLRSYRLSGGAAPLLPLLYLHRAARGAWKVLTGRK